MTSADHKVVVTKYYHYYYYYYCYYYYLLLLPSSYSFFVFLGLRMGLPSGPINTPTTMEALLPPPPLLPLAFGHIPHVFTILIR